MTGISPSNSVTEILNPSCLGNEHKVFIKRDDLIHPIVSGNKWRKLKYHINEAQKTGKNHLITFGGAYSNHLIATACAGAIFGIKTTAFVRGEELTPNGNFYLKLASLYGMQIIPVKRSEYKDKKADLPKQYFDNSTDYLVVDEGGAGENGEKGVSEIISELSFKPDYIIHASATGTTACGLLKGLEHFGFSETTLLPVCVLLNAEEQKSKLIDLNLKVPFELITGFECGGYAKTNPELMEFIGTFISETGILIDPVYTGKALFALKNLLSTNNIPQSKSILFLHTGGMLGLFTDKMLEKL